jgi:8-oxo-dGTP pyrophosphatase MutT (NUDIX family)
VPAAERLRARLATLATRPLRAEDVPVWAAGQRVGRAAPEFARAVAQAGAGLFELDGAGLVADPALQGEALSLRWAAVLERLRGDGWFPAWRDELYALRAPGHGATLCVLERGVFRRFGLRSAAVHLNGLRADGRMWIARRAAHKAVDPGRLDNLVGGGIAAGESAAIALLREAAEEAGIPAALAVSAKEVARLHARRPEADGVHDEDLHVYALTLPDDFVPENRDGEVAAFMPMTAAEVSARILADAFTEDAAAVASLWLLGRMNVTGVSRT